MIDRLNVLKEEAADQKAVDEVNEKLNALPAAEDILFANETAVTEARNAYEALDEIKEGLKDRVSAEALAKLTSSRRPSGCVTGRRRPCGRTDRSPSGRR